MNTTTISTSRGAKPLHTSPIHRVVGVVTRPQSYRNIAYLLLGLPLGTAWFTVLVSGLSVAAGMVAVALIGIPMLLGMWYVVRWSANVERRTANQLLGHRLAVAPMRSPQGGNVWTRLRSMTSDRDRWRELGYLMLRFPIGVATFTAAITALTTPFLVAYAPFAARYGSDHPFGHWSQSSRMEDIASSSPWSWALVPFGAVLLIASFHLLNAIAKACGRWTTESIGLENATAAAGRSSSTS
jgi:Putative sensor